MDISFWRPRFNPLQGAQAEGRAEIVPLDMLVSCVMRKGHPNFPAPQQWEDTEGHLELGGGGVRLPVRTLDRDTVTAPTPRD